MNAEMLEIAMITLYTHTVVLTCLDILLVDVNCNYISLLCKNKTRPTGEEPCGIVLRRWSSRRKVAELGARTRDLAGARTRPWAAAILVDTSSLLCKNNSWHTWHKCHRFSTWIPVLQILGSILYMNSYFLSSIPTSESRWGVSGSILHDKQYII
jgi:hypothetical protein